MSDKYLQQILDGLGQVRDYDEFESCVVDLLQSEYPKLVPVPGGSDRGFDGAIPDDDGHVIPLIVTTARRFSDVKRNLIQSIASARASGRLTRPKAVFATSFEVRGDRHSALRKAARENGVELLQVYGRSAIAQRLYRRSDLCARLLRLSGRPSALSAVPRSATSFPGVEPIGRERDLRWLRETRGDRLLCGQPGSGKTFLLSRLADEGGGLFASGNSRTEDLAAAIGDLQPEVVFVDDAHVRLDVVERLAGVRGEIGAPFSILATAWPGEAVSVAHALGGLSRSHVRKLELLTRDEMVELYRRFGIDVPNEIMRELVDQAANKPGLAAAIARAWLAGDRYDVWTGDVLRASIVARLGLDRRRSTALLACLSIGGDAGMPLESVARFLGAGLRDVREETARIHDGGVLHEVERGIVAVLPRSLRAPLLKEVFFSHGRAELHALDYRRLLQEVPSLWAGVLTLVEAVQRGVSLPTGELYPLILRAHEENPWRAVELWRRFAAAGEPEASWVLENYPGDVCDVAAATLRCAPDATIGRLLGEARTARGLLHNQPRHPLRIVSDWMRELDAGAEESLRRREKCVRLARGFVGSDEDRRVAIRAICLAMEPGLEGHSRDPGLGNRIELSWALLPPDALRRVATFWLDLRELITGLDVATWRDVSGMLGHWVHPEWVAHGPVEDAESRAALRAMVGTAARDLSAFAEHRPGLAHAIRELASAVDLDAGTITDPVFEILFPQREGTFEAERAASRRAGSLADLADSWSRRDPEKAVADLDLYVVEAALLGPGREDLTRALCKELASLVESPAPWLAALTQRPQPHPFLVEPFLARCVRERIEGWQGWLEYCLNSEVLSMIAVEQLLRLEGAPGHLMERALNGARRIAPMIETLASQRSIPLETMRRLLRGSDRIVALAAALGEWESDVHHRVRGELRDDWRGAILRITREELSSLGAVATLEVLLGEMLRKEAEVASAWLGRLFGGGSFFVEVDGPVSDAMDSLSPSQRGELLGRIEPASASDELISRLVARDESVYRKLLSEHRLSEYHAAPLAGMPEREWASMALVALEEGRSPAWVADAALGEMQVYFDSGEVELWDRWYAAFRGLEESTSDALRQVGAAGKMLVEKRRAKAIERHRERQVTGY